MTSHRTAGRSLLCLLALALPGCQTAQIQLSPALADVAPMPVEGANPRRWNAPVRFGPWSTVEVRESMTWGFGASLLGFDAGYMRQPYRVVLSGGGDPIQAECLVQTANLSRGDLSIDAGFGRLAPLQCAFRAEGGEGGEATLRLLDALRGGVLLQEGEIGPGGEPGGWTVRSLHLLEGARAPAGDPVGYEIRDGERVLAAVETVNQGRVWIAPAASDAERDRLAAAAAVLLIYRSTK